MTTVDILRRWFEEGVHEGHAFMIVACDTLSWEDYPVYTTRQGYAEALAEHDGKDMQTVMEVYDLGQDMEEQLAMGRCFRGP